MIFIFFLSIGIYNAITQSIILIFLAVTLGIIFTTIYERLANIELSIIIITIIGMLMGYARNDFFGLVIGAVIGAVIGFIFELLNLKRFNINKKIYNIIHNHRT